MAGSLWMSQQATFLCLQLSPCDTVLMSDGVCVLTLTVFLAMCPGQTLSP